MDFDEYEYLEKTVENPELEKAEKGTANGRDDHGRSGGEKERSRSSKHTSDEKDDEEGYERHRSKRSRSGEESRERRKEERKEERSSRHRSRSRDGDRDRHRSSRERRDRGRSKDRDERNGKEEDRDKDRERDRDRDREHERRDRDRDREKERDVDKDRETERSRRSGSRSDRHRSDRDERERSRDRERQERDRERERERELKERERESRKKKEEAEPEADPERDQRTVFAYQIALRADERDVYEFFSRAGKVRDVRLIMDRNSRRSKGVGYIEFYDAMSVPMAIALSGQPLLGQPVMVKPSEAEKNLVQSTTAATAGAGVPYSGGARRLYVGNLHVNITEDQLRQVFEPFGIVELVQLPLDETGHCKGFGFVQFSHLEDAKNALNLNGQVEIAGRPIKVSTVTDPTGVQETGTNTGDLDDDEGSGLSLNAHNRALLMQKLDRTGTASSIAGSLSTSALPSVPVPGAPPLVSPVVAPLIPGSVPAIPGFPGAGLQLPTMDSVGPSECLLLKNMFDPNVETEPDFHLDIRDDVKDECSKFGNLKHIFVDKNSAGFVYLRFETIQAAMNAQRALHGRWFAGKMITATFMVPQNYEAKFPDSK